MTERKGFFIYWISMTLSFCIFMLCLYVFRNNILAMHFIPFGGVILLILTHGLLELYFDKVK